MAFQPKVTRHLTIMATRERAHHPSPRTCRGSLTKDQSRGLRAGRPGRTPHGLLGASGAVPTLCTQEREQLLRQAQHCGLGHPDPGTLVQVDAEASSEVRQPGEVAAWGPCPTLAPPSPATTAVQCVRTSSCRVPGFLLGRKGGGRARWLQKPALRFLGAVLSLGGARGTEP